jgi:spore coat polysaccharide biosynthesis predicted glycosyltransferase SpsG
MATLIAGADVAIGASGTSSWERCCLALPAICVTQALNQVSIAKALEGRGAIVYLGEAEETRDSDVHDALSTLMAQPDRVRSLSSAAHDLVDGHGAMRVCQQLRTTS